MQLDVLTLDDFELRSKTVLLRVDINSPVDLATKAIKDDTRIQRCLPTIRELAEKGARVVVLAHQGDPLDYQNFTSLEQHARSLSRLLGREVAFLDDVAGPAARERIRRLRDGEILLLENVRIHTEETIIFEEEVNLSPAEQAKTYIVRNLAPLADLYVCDAFAAAHRSEPTLVAFQELLPSAAGRLFEEELRALTAVKANPERPCLFVLGGAKILDAFKMMRVALESGAADGVLTAGLTGQIMLLAAGGKRSLPPGQEPDAVRGAGQGTPGPLRRPSALPPGCGGGGRWGAPGVRTGGTAGGRDHRGRGAPHSGRLRGAHRRSQDHLRQRASRSL